MENIGQGKPQNQMEEMIVQAERYARKSGKSVIYIIEYPAFGSLAVRIELRKRKYYRGEIWEVLEQWEFESIKQLSQKEEVENLKKTLKRGFGTPVQLQEAKLFFLQKRPDHYVLTMDKHLGGYPVIEFERISQTDEPHFQGIEIFTPLYLKDVRWMAEAFLHRCSKQDASFTRARDILLEVLG